MLTLWVLWHGNVRVYNGEVIYIAFQRAIMRNSHRQTNHLLSPRAATTPLENAFQLILQLDRLLEVLGEEHALIEIAQLELLQHRQWDRRQINLGGPKMERKFYCEDNLVSKKA
jgi:hypothetical protein